METNYDKNHSVNSLLRDLLRTGANLEKFYNAVSMISKTIFRK
ncbi:MAG: hypothetical protein ABUK01_07115 [Leptospirales bacterium]